MAVREEIIRLAAMDFHSDLVLEDLGRDLTTEVISEMKVIGVCVFRGGFSEHESQMGTLDFRKDGIVEFRCSRRIWREKIIDDIGIQPGFVRIIVALESDGPCSVRLECQSPRLAALCALVRCDRQTHVVVACVHHGRDPDLAKIPAAIHRPGASHHPVSDRHKDSHHHQDNSNDDDQLDQGEPFVRRMVFFQNRYN